MQVERLEQSVESLSQENRDLYVQMQNAEKDMGGASYQLTELQKKEENYVQEILTLERHIDHVTRQLEDTQKCGREVETQRDQLDEELKAFKSISMNQEANKTEL